jgi:catechol 2,3-dioxygenase-like lactoylglutathione lyase family enzyme
MNTTSIEVVKLSVEVITLPVSDVERALRFYVDQVGFTLDVDYSPNDVPRCAAHSAGLQVLDTDR